MHSKTKDNLSLSVAKQTIMPRSLLTSTVFKLRNHVRKQCYS
jgi:hypothetical protein